MKKFITDSSLNIVAAFILMSAIQFVVFPILARENSAEVFGEILTLYSFITLISVVTGSTLNNVRLINYNSEKLVYNIANVLYLLLILTLILLASIPILNIYFELTFQEIIAVLLFTTLWSLKNYLIVIHRLKINYIQILLVNIVQVVFLVIGIYVLIDYFNWLSIFIISEFMVLLYICMWIYKSGIEVKYIKLSKSIRRQYFYLAIIAIANNFVSYYDRFFILPILGGEAVTQIFIATIFAKIALSLSSPINGVILTYLAQENIISRTMILKKIINVSILIFMVLIIVSVPVTNILIFLFYNEYQNIDNTYIILGTMGIAFLIMGNLLFPFSIKYGSAKKQTVIQYVYFSIYIILVSFSAYMFNLYGFFIALIISNLVRYILLIYSCRKYV